MTHESEGNYAGKRQGAELNEVIASSIKSAVAEGRISCAGAHSIAVKLNVEPADVGAAIDLLEVRIIKCQLGLFEPEKPALTGKLDPEIESAIKASLVEGRLSCLAAWEIAKKFDVSRMTISAACEAMKIKISSCQLGTFK